MFSWKASQYLVKIQCNFPKMSLYFFQDTLSFFRTGKGGRRRMGNITQ